ncbi:MAG: TetR/AcrR family transcriptional regulator [Sinomonas sp.]|nr:TetR/AcrR family transcriptional regulator [Sinomonas sp.]
MARPRGGSDRRAAIVTAATRLFADGGYDGVSLRQIAREAGVDAALVHHYFKGKENLFSESVQLPVDPEVILSGLDEFAVAERGRFVARAVIRLWEGPQRHALAAFLRSTISSTARSRLLADIVRRRILARIVDGLPGDLAERELRAAMVATQVVGFLLARYIVRLEPLASLPVEEAEALLAPAIQRHLTEPLPGRAERPAPPRGQAGQNGAEGQADGHADGHAARRANGQKSTVANVPTRSKPTRS